MRGKDKLSPEENSQINKDFEKLAVSRLVEFFY